MNIDPEQAKELDSDRVMAKSHAWQSYENCFALKAAIEAAGWKTAKDTPAVIEALEGLAMENSIAFPQGSKLRRAEDHSGMIDCYISQVQDGKFQMKKRISKEDLMAKLPPRYDFTTEKL